MRVRFGYRRLTVLLKREGWRVNAKRIYRLYGDRGARRCGRSRGSGSPVAPRVPLPAPTRPNERWSMDFVSARLADGRWFRTLTVLDLYTRESLGPGRRSIADRREGRGGAEPASLQRRSAPHGDHRRQRQRVRQSRDGCVGVRARRPARFHSPGQAGGECASSKASMAGCATNA